MFDVSQLKPQSPFVSNKSKLKLKESSTKKPEAGSGSGNFNVILDPNKLLARPLAETTPRTIINIDGFNIGNPLGFSSSTTRRTTAKTTLSPADSWSWTDVESQQGDAEGESLDKSPSVPEAIDLSNLITVTAEQTTTDTTTTESLSDWYQDFFSNLLAANEKKNPRSTTSTTTDATIGDEISVIDHDHHNHDDHDEHHEYHDAHHFEELAKAKKSLPVAPEGNLGLSITDSGLDDAERQFVTINNQVGFQLYKKLLENFPKDNLVFSPVSATSSLAMVFLGARGLTSWQINELLELDKMITFNPHQLYKNISDSLSVSQTENFSSSASKNILVSKDTETLIEFYKARAKYFYGAEVESISFSNIQEEIEERLNKDTELVTETDLPTLAVSSPMALVSGNYFQKKFDSPGRGSTMEFINLQRGRRLVPLSSIAWTGTFNAGYDQELGATAVELPYQDGELSLVLLLPGKISEFVAGGLEKLEEKLNERSWNKLLKSFVSHQLELEVPALTSHSVLNLNESLISLGITEAFSDDADFSGINGGKSLKISSFIQANKFSFEEESRAKREVKARVRQVDRVISMLARRNRQNQVYQLKFEREFLYVVRHNPTGLVIYIGRYYQPHHHHHDHRR